MPIPRFTLSAFGDEIASDLESQLHVLSKLHVKQLELRTTWNTNVADLNDAQLGRIHTLCQEAGVKVSCLGSRIGKTPLEEPLDHEVERLAQLMGIAHALDTRTIRVFSFYPPGGDANAYVEDAIARLGVLAEQAGAAGVTLVLENEKGVVGDTPQRCHSLLKGVASPHLRFAWDPANFVQCGVHSPMASWPLLQPYLGYVHIKDAAEDGEVRAAGEGVGQLRDLLLALKEMAYRGVLALEPHNPYALIEGEWQHVREETGMAYAVQTLRGLMEETGCRESEPT